MGMTAYHQTSTLLIVPTAHLPAADPAVLVALPP